MHRIVPFVLTALLAATSPVAVVAGPLDPVPCTPRTELDVARPESCRRITYKIPLHVTPGDNLILFGPIQIERPQEEGWIVRFEPGLEYVDGSTPPIEVLHLHHAVWISTAYGHPLFASGEEKTTFSLPDGYGLRVRPWNEVWLLNYMLHNQQAKPDNVFITYTIDFIPRASGPAQRDVVPYWTDVVGGFYPVYNTQRAFGGPDGECAFPRERCAARDPFGRSAPNGNGLGDRTDPPDGTVVFMAGHLHPGGLRLDVEVERGTARTRAFTSDAVYYDPGGPISWDMVMEVTRPDFRLRMQPGDRFVVNSVYETQKASWYEGMGIVVMFIAPGDTSGADAFAPGWDPDAAGLTHGHLPEASNHGGPDRSSELPPLRPLPTDRVEIAGFTFAPGGSGTYAAGIPAVRAGAPLTFVNLDAAAQIYHTVTACKAPCDGPTGISYPLANGPVDFDSAELGYGIPEVTPAANTHEYRLSTTGFTPGAYTYFCRVHPSMRGAFAVT